MSGDDDIRGRGRWILWVLAALAIGILAGTLETGPAHALSNSAFTFLGALTNVITPNGDGINDFAILCFDNPRASDVSGAVYDLRGAKVSGMSSPAPGDNCPGTSPGVDGTVEKMTWDGKSSGRVVAGGVYVYEIQAEHTTVTGTVVVVR